MSKKGSFSKLIDSDKPVLVDFHATWCQPCHMLAPILKDVAKDLKDEAKVIKVDIDRNRVIAERYQIRSVPTMILFKKGKPVWKQSGVLPKGAIMQAIKQHV